MTTNQLIGTLSNQLIADQLILNQLTSQVMADQIKSNKLTNKVMPDKLMTKRRVMADPLMLSQLTNQLMADQLMLNQLTNQVMSDQLMTKIRVLKTKSPHKGQQLLKPTRETPLPIRKQLLSARKKNMDLPTDSGMRFRPVKVDSKGCGKTDSFKFEKVML